MDKSLYEIMQEILEEKKSDFTQDIEYLGTITSNETSAYGNVQVTKDIFMIIDEMPDGTVVQKFYDENKNFIAGRDKDGRIYPSAEFAQDDLSFIGQLEDLSQTQGLSLTEFDTRLEQIAKELGIAKKDILSMSEFDLEQKVADKSELTLDVREDDERDDDEIKKQNAAALENINSKQETKLDNKVTDRYTMADILGVSSGSTLIAVYSDAIKGNTNTTRFSFIIREPDGSLKPCDMLEQDRGKYPDLDVYQTNRDGSEVSKQSVQSAYAINSPIVKNGVLTANIGSYGTIELGFGQKGHTRSDEAITQRLETREVRYTTREVREQFTPQKEGVYGPQANLDEGKFHMAEGHKTTLKDFDGDPTSSSQYHESYVEMIKSYDSEIADVFTDREIEERLQKIAEEYPTDSFEEIISRTQRELAEDASRMHGGH